jgi:hypothetical protein
LEKRGRTYSKLSKVLSERKKCGNMINKGGSMKDNDKEKAAAL